MKQALVTAALGFGVMIGSLVSGSAASAAPLGGVGATSVRAQACSCSQMVTTSNLNLRTGPGTEYDVILVMPSGSEVKVGDTADLRQNGFAKVGYDGSYGWASLDYLADVQGGGEFDTSQPEYDIVGSGTANDRVNVRVGPGLEYAVKDVLSAVDQVEYSNEVLNGFRYVNYSGLEGWVYDLYLDLDGGSGSGGGGGYDAGETLFTTSSLNLRAEPSLSADVILVMPDGATVTATGSEENGFVGVTYNGQDGWAYADYLTS